MLELFGRDCHLSIYLSVLEGMVIYPSILLGDCHPSSYQFQIGWESKYQSVGKEDAIYFPITCQGIIANLVIDLEGVGHIFTYLGRHAQYI